MKGLRGWLVCAGTLALLAAPGCPLLRKAPPEAGKASDKGAVARSTATRIRYVDASEGLPKSRIWKSQIAFGDVNGDGFADLGAISRLADGPWIFASDGKGRWTPVSEGLPRETFCGGGVDFGDVNNDGHVDVALADHCKGVYVFLGDGAGNWKMASSGLPSIGAEDVALGDFDNDGCLDLVSVAAQEEGVRAFRGDCTGIWKETSDGLAVTEWGNGVVMADINGDGNLDIAAAYSAGPRVWFGDGKGGWREASTGLPAPEIHGLYWGIAVGDVNGDGLLDLASGSQMPPQPRNCGEPGQPVCEGGGLEVFLQVEPGVWKSSNAGIRPMNALGVAIGDLDNDGHNDVVAVGKKALGEIGGVYGVFPYLGDGSGNWSPATGTGLPETGRERAWGVALGDVNGDGVLDIAVAFGDVVAPSWRSGNPGAGAPQRGKFGALQVWLGNVVR